MNYYTDGNKGHLNYRSMLCEHLIKNETKFIHNLKRNNVDESVKQILTVKKTFNIIAYIYKI